MTRHRLGQDVINRNHGPKLFKFSICPTEHLEVTTPTGVSRLVRVLSISDGDIQLVDISDARPSGSRKADRKDLELLERILPGTRCLCTVPNFPYESHVRHFKSEQEVHQRYGRFFDSMSVWGIVGAHGEGVVYYLFDGKRKTSN